MKCYKMLRDRFSRLDTSVRDWIPKSDYPRSRDTANIIVHREDPVDPTSYVYFAHCLGFSNNEVLDLMGQYEKELPKFRSDCTRDMKELKVMRKLFSPMDITTEETDILNGLRKLDEHKRKLVLDMIKTMEG